VTFATQRTRPLRTGHCQPVEINWASAPPAEADLIAFKTALGQVSRELIGLDLNRAAGLAVIDDPLHVGRLVHTGISDQVPHLAPGLTVSVQLLGTKTSARWQAAD
jgi:hypothetical protein